MKCLIHICISWTSLWNMHELRNELEMVANLSVDCPVLRYWNLITAMEGLMEFVERQGFYPLNVLDNMDLYDRNFIFLEFSALFCFLFVLIFLPLWLSEVLWTLLRFSTHPEFYHKSLGHHLLVPLTIWSENTRMCYCVLHRKKKLQKLRRNCWVNVRKKSMCSVLRFLDLRLLRRDGTLWKSSIGSFRNICGCLAIVFPGTESA